MATAGDPRLPSSPRAPIAVVCRLGNGEIHDRPAIPAHQIELLGYPREQVAERGHHVRPRVRVVVGLVLDPAVLRLGVDVAPQEGLRQRGAGRPVYVERRSAVRPEGQGLMDQRAAVLARPAVLVAHGDAEAREDLGVAPLAPLALDALHLLAGGVAEVLESGRVLGEPLPRSADHGLGEVGSRLPSAHQLPDEAEAALGVDLGEEAARTMPPEIPAAEDDPATVERQPADVVRLAELRKDARPVAGVPVALELTLEIIGIGIRDALRMEP